MDSPSSRTPPGGSQPWLSRRCISSARHRLPRPRHQLPSSSPRGYTHRPRQLRAELAAAGFDVIDLVCVEGVAYLLDDLGDRLAGGEARRVLETARALERVPELLGIGPHLLITAR